MTKVVKIGARVIGGGNPILIQSMCNTATEDVEATVPQQLRLAQAAEYFAQDEFIKERAMACRTEEDVRRLFCIEAPSYWRTHHVPGAESDESPKRNGTFKANIIGINLVAVLQFAYGRYTGSERLRASALPLLDRLPAAATRYMRAWPAAGVRPRNAFESQALLQLATEYCAARRCAECPVGRRIAKSLAED